MENIPALINPRMLRWARNQMGWSIKQAAQELELSPVLLRLWEQGEEQPTIERLREVCKVYNRPLAVFYLPHPPRRWDVIIAGLFERFDAAWRALSHRRILRPVGGDVMWGYDTAVLLPDGDILIETFANNSDYVELPERAAYGQRVFVGAEEYRRRQTSVMRVVERAKEHPAKSFAELAEKYGHYLDGIDPVRFVRDMRNEPDAIAFTGEYCDQ